MDEQREAETELAELDREAVDEAREQDAERHFWEVRGYEPGQGDDV